MCTIRKWGIVAWPQQSNAFAEQRLGRTCHNTHTAGAAPPPGMGRSGMFVPAVGGVLQNNASSARTNAHRLLVERAGALHSPFTKIRADRLQAAAAKGTSRPRELPGGAQLSRLESAGGRGKVVHGIAAKRRQASHQLISSVAQTIRSRAAWYNPRWLSSKEMHTRGVDCNACVKSHAGMARWFQQQHALGVYQRIRQVRLN